jgi:hypothetical protein
MAKSPRPSWEIPDAHRVRQVRAARDGQASVARPGTQKISSEVINGLIGMRPRASLPRDPRFDSRFDSRFHPRRSCILRN